MAIAGAALLIPLATGMDAMRQILFRADGVLGVWPEIGLLAALAVIFLASAKWCLDVLERKSQVEGRLTVRWE
jgi:ABC-2 type transport system permease protein